MDSLSRELAEDFFLREPVDARIKQKKVEENDEKPKLRVEMQTLRLNSDSQKLVLDTLRFIHGPDFKLGSAGVYKDKGSKLNNRYWMERGNLVVQGGFDYSTQIKDGILTPECKMRNFSLSKLESYGYHKPHCAEALDVASDDTNKALQILYQIYFNINENDKPHDVPSINDLLDLRKDEKDVLLSIYDDSFQVKDTNTWCMKLNLEYITKTYSKTYKETPQKVNINYNNKNNNFKTKKRDVCRNFKSGKCIFGNKCRFLHKEAVAKAESADFSESINYELEIRFPEDSLYPYEPPILCVKTVSKTDALPELLCLRITARLLDEARILTADGIPCVYSLVEILKNEEDILRFLSYDTRKFPSVSDMLYPVQTEEAQLKKSLPSHYKKAESRDNRMIGKLAEMLKDNQDLAKRFKEKMYNGRYKAMLNDRSKLPAWAKKKDILNSIAKSQVVVISGETGCGKSTQVPQFILDNWLENLGKGTGDNQHVDIVCTQPRRISAIGVAERVADERVEKIGQVVGYQIRLESKTSSKTRLTFCTTGILLRRLEYDPQLESVTHIIVDEVHERSEESDFLLVILRDLVRVRKNLSVILMSATLNADLFSDYFNGVPILEIAGRTFPVKQIFLEEIIEMSYYVLEENGPYSRKLKKGDKKQDMEVELETCDLLADSNQPPKPTIRDENLTISQFVARYPHSSKLTCKTLYTMNPEKINLELIEHVLMYIVNGDHEWPHDGAILIFLPGISEIMSLYDQLCESKTFGPSKGKFKLLPLHSTLSSDEQSQVFSKTGKGVRKIVLSTNIAETSVTIDDCVFVIDCGKMKEIRFDSNRNMESLDLVWISRANAKQRMGRAGRVMPGVCIHLFTSFRYKNHLLEQPVPEIHRIPLEQLLLKIKVLPLFDGMNVHQVLAKTIEPPIPSNIDGALERLQDVGAMDKHHELTALGKHLAALPVDVRIGKLMLFGAIFCCVDSALTMAACLSYKNPFVAPFGKKEEADSKRREFATFNSDHLTILKAYKNWRKAFNQSRHAGHTFANENFLSSKSLMMLCDIKHQLLTLLASIGFVPDVGLARRGQGKDNVFTMTGAALNINGDNDKLLAAILCAALYPNVVKVLTPEKSFNMSAGGAVPRQPLPEELRFKTKSDGYVSIHPSSVNYVVGHFPSPYLVYQEKVKTSKIFIRDCSMVPKLPLVLFTGCDLVVELYDGIFVVSLEDGWIMFQVENHEVAEMLKCIRTEMVELLQEKINDPCLNLLHHDKGNRIINTIVQIVTKE